MPSLRSDLYEYQLSAVGGKRIVESRVLCGVGGGKGKWRRASWAEMLRAEPKGGAVWAWLLQHGIRRPSPSGRSGRTQAEEDRNTVRVVLRLSPEAAKALEDLRITPDGYVTRSSVAADLILRERRRTKR